MCRNQILLEDMLQTLFLVIQKEYSVKYVVVAGLTIVLIVTLVTFSLRWPKYFLIMYLE